MCEVSSFSAKGSGKRREVLLFSGCCNNAFMRIRKEQCLSWMILNIVLSSSGLLAGNQVVTPEKPIQLFNGKDLTNFYTWLVDHGKVDPKRVFSVVDDIDGSPAIRISGEEWGGLITDQAYRDYRLIVEFRWGLTTWGNRRRAARDSGILLHCQGVDGNNREDFNGAWMRSLETQVIEGGVGDFIPVFGYDRSGKQIGPAYTATVRRDSKGDAIYDPEGKMERFERRRVNWFGHDPEWKDILGFRGRADVESPEGEWTKIEIICANGSVKNIVNGVLVNAVTDCNFDYGKILIQSEGAELYLRQIRLLPLK